jgi:hypothetical protein
MNSPDMVAEVAVELIPGVVEGSVFNLENISEVRRWSKGRAEPVSHIPLHVAAVD